MSEDGIAATLRQGNIANFAQEARWIAEELTGEAALAAARRRAAGEPLQYVLGTAPFRDLMLAVDRRVLIPRPETEELAGWVIANLPKNGALLDLGTGSGAIALAAAQERPDATVTAVDLSADALEVAESNARRCGLTGRVEWLESDLFSALPGRKFDLVAANLPYVTEDEYPALDAEVRDFEPKMALVAGDAGLELILRAVRDLPEHLKRPGRAIFELSPPQAARAAAAVEAAGLRAGVLQDLCGRDRFVTGEW